MTAVLVRAINVATYILNKTRTPLHSVGGQVAPEGAPAQGRPAAGKLQDPARQEQDQQDDKGAEKDRPPVAAAEDAGQRLLHRIEQERADDWAPDGAGPADQADDDHLQAAVGVENAGL